MPPTDDLAATREALDAAKASAADLASRLVKIETSQVYEVASRERADTDLAERIGRLDVSVSKLAATVEAHHRAVTDQLNEIRPFARFFDRVLAELSSWAIKAIVFALVLVALLAAAGVSPTWLVQRVITPPAAGGP